MHPAYVPRREAKGDQEVRPPDFLGRTSASRVEHTSLTPTSKRKGFDKALFQIEQAVKRAKSGKQTSEDHKAILNLRNLLGDTVDSQLAGPANAESSPGQPSSTGDTHGPVFSDDDHEAEDSPNSRPCITHPYEDSRLTVHDAENPLQLLARASNLQLSPAASGSGNSPGQRARPGNKKRQSRNDEDDSEIQSYFTSIRVNLDVGEDIDPIDVGLVTEAEADELFN